MIKTRAVQVRFTREQHEQLRLTASSRGFDTLAAYIRFAALDRQRLLEDKVVAIHQRLFEDETQLKKRRRSDPNRLPEKAWG